MRKGKKLKINQVTLENLIVEFNPRCKSDKVYEHLLEIYCGSPVLLPDPKLVERLKSIAATKPADGDWAGECAVYNAVTTLEWLKNKGVIF